MIIQDDLFDTASVTLCPFTTNEAEAETFRLEIARSVDNGLDDDSRLMIDKVSSVSRIKLGIRLGRLTRSDMLRVDRALVLFLGLAS